MNILKGASVLLLSNVLTVGNAENKPNIILIMADDLGWGDTGFNGNTIIKTPYLDQMASDGINFTRFYSASAVSSPTRASVLTGRNPYRMGIFTANHGVLRPEEITIPELLKNEGYNTGHFGKWHLGTLTVDEKDSNRGRTTNTKEFNPPIAHGYDVAFVTEAKVPTWDPMKKPLGKVSNDGWKYIDNEEYAQYGTAYWDIDGNKVTENLDGDDSRIVMDRVLPFIENSINEKKPFIATVWFHTPHKPCVAGPEYAAMYKEYDLDVQNYAGCITAMDDQIGRLREFLKANNVDENTLIYFCSDNGPENNTPGLTGGFRARKRSLYEGGVRVPSVAVWPKGIKKSLIVSSPIYTSDYLPTIASIVGIDLSKLLYELDGIDMSSCFNGDTLIRTKPIVLTISNIISCNTSRYKLYMDGKKIELYDIINDPYETTPLNNKHITDSLFNQSKLYLNSYMNSFKGVEYGQESVNKLNQSDKSFTRLLEIFE